jgi:Ca-activated chloride channel family protein
MSRLREDVLQAMTLATDGVYVRSISDDRDLSEIYQAGIREGLETAELGTTRRKRWNERFQWLLAISIAALMLEPLIPSQRKGAVGERGSRGSGARTRGGSGVAVALALLVGVATAAAGDQPVVPEDRLADEAQANDRRTMDPFDAYRSGDWRRALEGFLDLQTQQPDSAAVAIDLGSAFYRLEQYSEADRQFSRGAGAQDGRVRQQALYNHGNAAYRQGKLEQAVDLYERALELDPEDEDARYNRDFVQREIERRRKAAQESPERKSTSDSGADEASSGDEPQGDQEGERSSVADRGQPGDQDGDALPDSVETGGENPTDPLNPDTDGDGLEDGEEDLNRNGRLDPGETDPNQPDSGEGGSQAETSGDGLQETQVPARSGLESAELSEEEAERYLQAIEEGLPRRSHPGRPMRPEKDW